MPSRKSGISRYVLYLSSILINSCEKSCSLLKTWNLEDWILYIISSFLGSSSSSLRLLWNNCSLQRKTDLSWTCPINYNKLLNAQSLDRRSGVWYDLFVFHFVIDFCKTCSLLETWNVEDWILYIFCWILDDELHHHGDCCLHSIMIIDLRCMICSEEFVFSNDCILVHVTLRSKTLAMYLCVSRSKVYSPCILFAFRENLRI